MSKQEARDERINEWLEHLHRWEATGRSLASYAKEHGLPLWALHRLRSAVVKTRTALANQLRGLLAEFGLVVPKGLHRLRRKLPDLLEDADNSLPPQVVPLLNLMDERMRASGYIRIDETPLNAISIVMPLETASARCHRWHISRIRQVFGCDHSA